MCKLDHKIQHLYYIYSDESILFWVFIVHSRSFCLGCLFVSLFCVHSKKKLKLNWSQTNSIYIVIIQVTIGFHNITPACIMERNWEAAMWVWLVEIKGIKGKGNEMSKLITFFPFTIITSHHKSEKSLGVFFDDVKCDYLNFNLNSLSLYFDKRYDTHDHSLTI